VADIREIGGKEHDKGTYILLAHLDKTQKIKPGKLPEADYKMGIYLYVGRARTGLKARINRHIRRQKKLFWHIDYLLQRAKIVEIWIRKDYFGECNTADEIGNFKPNRATAIQEFGSSDCRCRSHLFYFPPDTKGLRSLRNKIGFKRVKIDGN
jgi:sugar fermentation stimulation protein A